MKSIISCLTLFIMAIAVQTSMAAQPVAVNASDLIGKVYGVADPSKSESQCRQEAESRFDTTPEAEAGAEWLSSDNGFILVYEGLSPEVEAMVRYDRGEVAAYGYLFYFPYASAQRSAANHEQCEFCAALLQELSDMGVALGSDLSTDALFDVTGAYKGGDVQLTLREEVESETVTADLPAGAIPADREGQFILMINVVPANAVALTAEAN